MSNPPYKPKFQKTTRCKLRLGLTNRDVPDEKYFDRARELMKK